MKRSFIVAAIAVFVFLFQSAGVVQAQYPTPTPACGCTVDGNCYGQGCTTGEILECEVQCDPHYRNVAMWCGPVGSGLYCGGKCIYEQTCVTGYCQGPTCSDIEGDFLCGSGGCNACQRFVKETICSGDHCQSWCSNDATCGVGCGGGPGGGATNTPQPPGPTHTPGPTPTNTPGPSPTPTPPGQGCGVLLDNQAFFEAGIGYLAWSSSGTGSLGYSWDESDHTNAWFETNSTHSLKVNFIGPSSGEINGYSIVTSAPNPGESAHFFGSYKVNSTTGSPSLKACIVHWFNHPVGTWYGRECIDLDTLSPGVWKSFEFTSQRLAAYENENNIEVNIIHSGGPAGSTADINFDNVCLNYIPAPTPAPTPIPTPTPIPVGTIKARAVRVSLVDASNCTAIRASSVGADGATVGFTAGSPASKTQSGANYVVFSGIPANPTSYSLQVTPPVNWVIQRYCLLGHIPEDVYSATLSDGETLTWDVGYTLGNPWVQTQGGDVYASGSLTSTIPLGSKFNADGTGGYPGIVTYWSTYNFGSPPLISSKDWLVKAERTTVDYYDLFYHRFGAPTAT